jgi:FkbM family methyltransferase
VLPDRLKTMAYYRLYNPLPAYLKPLLENAPLRFAPGVAMTALVDGDIISGSIALTGFYELELSRRIAKAAAQGGRLVDVGSNLGYFSLIWLAARPDNTCISFEASPRTFALLKRNIESNGFQDRCRFEGMALGKERGSLGFDPGPRSQSGWGGLILDKTPDTVDVEVFRLDKIITDDEAISVLKIDTEGADSWVLQGSEGLLSKSQVQTIYYEYNKQRAKPLGIGDDEARELLERNGYRVEVLSHENETMFEYKATKG